jgi:hypothetical protein
MQIDDEGVHCVERVVEVEPRIVEVAIEKR